MPSSLAVIIGVISAGAVIMYVLYLAIKENEKMNAEHKNKRRKKYFKR